MVTLALAAASLFVIELSAAQAGERRDAFEAELAQAAAALHSGEFSRAAARAERLAEAAGRAERPEDRAESGEGGAVPRSDRAEAWRIFGLALFFEGELGRAEDALVEYLKLEEDAHLDPALVPPEAIVFFEDVRSRRSAEIRAYHPDPDARRYRLLNLAPPAGQFQNGDRRKGWTLAASGTALLGLNVGTYALLRSFCDGDSGLCGEDGARYRQARALRAVNMASIVGLGALYAYGVMDGFAGLRGADGGASIRLAPLHLPGIGVSGQF